jgi:hypothetical protein
MPPARPRNYFLNESDELFVEELGGGGAPAKYLNVNWPQKSRKLRAFGL